MMQDTGGTTKTPSGKLLGTGRWEPSSPPVRYPDPDVLVLDPRFGKLVLGLAAIERIAGGCRFTEGPVWCLVPV